MPKDKRSCNTKHSGSSVGPQGGTKKVWKSKAQRLERSKKCAWARYYEEERQHHMTLTALRECVTNAQSSSHIPKHISDKYIELVVAYDKEMRECPICLEGIKFAGSRLTDCGHLFHEECISKLDICPVCRGKYAKKSVVQQNAGNAADNVAVVTQQQQQ